MTRNVAEKLKKIRRLRNLSTSELARISGVHQTTISAIENGKHNSPGIETIERLAKALRISPLYFFEDRVQTPFDLFENLPEEVKEFLLREESFPYLMLSKEAYENGISSHTLHQLLSVLRESSSNQMKQKKNNSRQKLFKARNKISVT